MFCLCTGKGFGERVREHIVRGTVDKLDISVGNHVPYEVVPDIDVLCACVELTKFGVSEGEHQLVVVVDNDGIVDGCKQLRNELSGS